jgi:hypothetical protein
MGTEELKVAKVVFLLTFTCFIVHPLPDQVWRTVLPMMTRQLLLGWPPESTRFVVWKALNSLSSLCLYGRALYGRVISQCECNLCGIWFDATQINETAQGVQAVGGYVRLKREIRPCSRGGYAEHHSIGSLRLKRERQHLQQVNSCRNRAANGEEEELGGPPDDGPLAGIASKVLSVTIYDKDSTPGRDR